MERQGFRLICSSSSRDRKTPRGAGSVCFIVSGLGKEAKRRATLGKRSHSVLRSQELVSKTARHKEQGTKLQ
jgi:hypothetical protein